MARTKHVYKIKVRRHRRKKKKSRFKKGVYKGMKLDSGWELAFVLWCQDNGKTIIRNTQKFPYIYKGRRYNWIPDFLVDGKWVEIKGRENAKTFAKYNHFQHTLTILRRAEILPILKYVETKYGKDFHRLYEK